MAHICICLIELPVFGGVSQIHQMPQGTPIYPFIFDFACRCGKTHGVGELPRNFTAAEA